jgi:signal transduction histidine kinase
MATGYEQARSVVAEIAGDHVAAREVHLVLPETGVCNTGPAVAAAAGCCGGPAPAEVDACCVRDVEAKEAGRDGCGDRAEILAEEGVTVEMLGGLARSLPPEALDTALDWIAANTAMRRMTAEIQDSASRIHHLVDAVKGFTQMDRESVSEPVDVAQGLANTLVVLRAKAKSKSSSLTLDVASDLPPVCGFAGELNQVWFNLIGNALDAAGEGGRVEVTARPECGGVVVRVIDNGPGIPEGIQDRIFDPFFTTKPVGEGSGLGLDIVRRLIQRHNGQIELDSRPGRTEFRVILS